MHVISRKMLRLFWEQHPDAEAPLQAWYKAARKADWRNFADVRAWLPHADQVERFRSSTSAGTSIASLP